MKVLLFNGSPREKGCTFTALRVMEEIFNQNEIETKIICVGKEQVQGFNFLSPKTILSAKLQNK